MPYRPSRNSRYNDLCHEFLFEGKCSRNACMFKHTLPMGHPAIPATRLIMSRREQEDTLVGQLTREKEELHRAWVESDLRAQQLSVEIEQLKEKVKDLEVSGVEGRREGPAGNRRLHVAPLDLDVEAQEELVAELGEEGEEGEEGQQVNEPPVPLGNERRLTISLRESCVEVQRAEAIVVPVLEWLRFDPQPKKLHTDGKCTQVLDEDENKVADIGRTDLVMVKVKPGEFPTFFFKFDRYFEKDCKHLYPRSNEGPSFQSGEDYLSLYTELETMLDAVNPDFFYCLISIGSTAAIHRLMGKLQSHHEKVKNFTKVLIVIVSTVAIVKESEALRRLMCEKSVFGDVLDVLVLGHPGG